MLALTLTRCVALAALALLAVSSTLASPSDDGKRGGARRMTNGERLARGLTPNKPDLRRSPAQQRRGTSATITTTSSSSATTSSSGPATSSSLPPPPAPSCAAPGIIKAYGANINGYLDNGGNSDNPNINVITNISAAGTFCLDNSRPVGPYNFEAMNYDTQWPAGLSLAVVGNYPSFGPNVRSPGYLQPGSTTQPLGLPTRESFTALGPVYAESAIWYLDPSTNIITAQWLNPDGLEASDFAPLAFESEGGYIEAWAPASDIGPAQALTFEWVPY